MTIQPQWQALLKKEQAKPYFIDMMTEINHQRQQGEVIYPEPEQVLNAFCYQDLKQTKVVILGQDPYHGENQAHGLAFSVQKGVKTPPSLKNIYKELAAEFTHFSEPEHGNLAEWATQGVLLLNTVLTVKKGQAHSHAKLGWENFTSAVIDYINQENQGCVFLLWGAHAQKKGKAIDTAKHLVLNGPHPSPLSAYRGFFGCQHFSKANSWLTEQGLQAINWSISAK